MTNIIHYLVVLLLLVSAFPQVQAAPVAQSAAPVSYEVRYHPDGELQVGDLISFDVFRYTSERAAGRSAGKEELSVRVIHPIQANLGSVEFSYEGSGTWRAILRWAWDTAGLSPGDYQLEFTATEEDHAWTDTVRLTHASGSKAEWASIETACCEVFYITGSQAEEDIEYLAHTVQSQYDRASGRLGEKLEKKLSISFIPRVLGHGGFATNELYISYPSRNYISINFPIVVHHEIVHRLDREKGGDLKPTILVEGLAVWASRGHYRIENIPQRAAALLRSESYIPLRELTDEFYPAQHEAGYIQGGALVEYLVEIYGWEEFDRFYRDIHSQKDEKQSSAIDQALQEHFSISFDEMEQGFIKFLQNQVVTRQTMRDVESTLRFYDTVRLYQQKLDPSAYFRQAWLPPGNEMRSRGIVDDFVQSPDRPENQAIESLLASTGRLLRAGRYDQAKRTLEVIDFLLAGVPAQVELVTFE